MPDDVERQQDAVDRWCRAGEQGDAAAAAACLAADVELVSPLTEQFRFHGRGQVRDLLVAAFITIEGIEYHTRLTNGRTCALFYRAHLGAQPLEEAQLLHLDDTGLIRQITLFGRPLPALTGLMSALGPLLARQQGRTALATLLALSTAPLHALSRSGDRHVVPLTTPRTGRRPTSR